MSVRNLAIDGRCKHGLQQGTLQAANVLLIFIVSGLEVSDVSDLELVKNIQSYGTYDPLHLSCSVILL